MERLRRRREVHELGVSGFEFRVWGCGHNRYSPLALHLGLGCKCEG